MKMHSLSFLIAASLALSACGDNNSSDNQQSNANENPNTDQTINTPDLLTRTQHWTTYRLDVTGFIESNNDIYSLQVGSADTYFINDTAYFMPDTQDFEDNQIFVTKDGEYRSYTGQFHPQYGAESGKFKQLAPNELTLSRYSEIGSKGFEETTRYKVLDLNNQPVLKHLTPELDWQLQYPNIKPLNVSAKDKELLTRLSETKFPQGSICLQMVETENNQDHLMLSPHDSMSKFEFDRLVERYNEKDPTVFKLTFKDTTAYLNVSKRKDGSLEPNPSNSNAGGYAQYKNNYYYADYHPAGVNYNLPKWVEENKQRINQSSLNAEEKKARLASVDAESYICDLYNPTATNFIKSIVKL